MSILMVAVTSFIVGCAFTFFGISYVLRKQEDRDFGSSYDKKEH